MKILITGGTSGIGKAVALNLGAKGHDVIVVGGKSEERGQELKKEFDSLSGTLKFYPIDLSNIKTIKNFAQQFTEEATHLDVLFLNAGIFPKNIELDENNVYTSFNVNYFHKFIFIVLLNDLLRKSNGKILINGAMNYVRELDLSKAKFGRHLGVSAGMQIGYALSYLSFHTNKLFNTGVPIMGLSPGYVKTRSTETMSWFLRFFLRPFMILPEKAAENIAYVIEHKLKQENDGAFFNGRKQTSFGKSITSKKDVFIKLWDLSLNLSKLETPKEWQ